MAVAFGHSSQAQQAASITSKTWAHDCTGDNYLVVIITHRNNPGAITCTYNGVSMTLLASESATYNWESMFGLASPATGSNNIAASWASGTNIGAVAMSFSGVSSIGTAIKASVAGSSSNFSTTSETLTANDMLVGGAGVPDSGTPLSCITGTERVENGATTDAATNGATNTGTGGVVITWNYTSASDPKTWIAVKLVGAGAYSTTLSESQTATDDLLASTARTLSESKTATDDLLASTARTLTESKTATDTFVSAFIILTTLSETVSAIDSIIRSGIRVLADSVTATAAFIQESVRSLLDSITATDTFATVLALGRILTESVSTNDTIRKLVNGSSTVWTDLTKTVSGWINREKL